MSIERMIAKAGKTLRVERRADTRDPGGGRRSGWATVAGTEGTACWPQPAKSHVRQAYASRDLVVTTSVFVATELGVLEGDRLIVSDSGGSEIGTLLAAGAELDQAGLGKVFRIDCKEAQ